MGEELSPGSSEQPDGRGTGTLSHSKLIYKVRSYYQIDKIPKNQSKSFLLRLLSSGRDRDHQPFPWGEVMSSCPAPALSALV